MNGIVNEGPWPQLETMCSSQADWHIADFCDKFIWGQIKCCIYTASTQLFDSSFQVKEIDAIRRKKNPTCQIAKMCVQSWHMQFPMEWEQGENLPRTWVDSRGKGCLLGEAAWGNRQTQTMAQGGLSFNVWSATYWGFHGSSEAKKKKKNTYQCRRRGFDHWIGNIPWKRKWQFTPVFLPGKSHGQRSVVGYSPWGHRESDMT